MVDMVLCHGAVARVLIVPAVIPASFALGALDEVFA